MIRSSYSCSEKPSRVDLDRKRLARTCTKLFTVERDVVVATVVAGGDKGSDASENAAHDSRSCCILESW